MKRYEAIGVVETQYFAVAMELLDHICKGSHVTFLSSEKYLGGRLVSLVFGGSISDVTEAVRVAKQVGARKPNKPLKKALVITNPHEEILRFIMAPTKKKSMKKVKKKTGLTNNKEENENE